MKGTTKFWLGAGTALAGAWAWMRYGNSTSVAASRVAPPGYTSSRYLTDATGRQVAMVFVYPFIESDAVGKFARVLTVPIDPTKRGTWSTIRELQRVPV